MLPLDPLAKSSPIARLLKGAPAAAVHAELARLAASDLDAITKASLMFASGSLSLREGSLDAAHADLTAASTAFAALGEAGAARLASCEAILASIRRGPRDVFAPSIAALDAIAKEASDDVTHARARCVALHYMGAATRASGDAVGTERLLLSALAASDRILDERAKILNSLGTLYVVMGAFGAAKELLEHAAELHHQTGDAVGEAIACGQLGAAALGLGDLEGARRCLQKQEWLAARVGDTFGRARALTFLADVALELGRPDDAVLFATMARDLASSATPPLRMWIAYSTRALGRAKIDLADPSAASELRAASDLFATIGNPLGSALTAWDQAGLSQGSRSPTSWFTPAWGLASLGLAPRVAQLLRDQRARVPSGQTDTPRASEMAIAAVAQVAPHVAVAHEVHLVHEAPEELSAVAGRRTAAQRNLSRLAALTLASPGLFVAVALGPHSRARRALPPERSSAALAYEIPGAVVWIWPKGAPLADVSRDLAHLRSHLGELGRASLTLANEGRVASPPFAGEVSADLDGVDILDSIAAARAQAPGELVVDTTIEWPAEADAAAAQAGYAVSRRKAT